MSTIESNSPRRRGVAYSFLVLAIAGLAVFLLPRAWQAGPDPIDSAKAWLLAAAYVLACGFVWIPLHFSVPGVLAGIRSGARRHPGIAALGIGGVFAGVLVIGMEVAFGIANHFRAHAVATVTVVEPKDCQKDDRLGYRLQPNVSSTARKTRSRDAKEIYSVHYSTDAAGRRFCPDAAAAASATPEGATVAFFGGSFMFGEGVQDDETLPHLFSQAFAKFSPGHLALNYGCHGYGPNQMLAMLEFQKIELPTQAGRPLVGVYGYIDDHVGRTVGAMRHVNWFCDEHPYYEPTPDGNLTHRGQFRTARPVRSVIYWLLGKSQTLEFFGFNWPLPNSDSALDLTARVIARSRDEFRTRYGSDQFFVLIYPGCVTAAALIAKLDDLGVRHLDYSKLLDPQAAGMSFELDGHPTPAANRIVAQRLAEDLKNVTR